MSAKRNEFSAGEAENVQALMQNIGARAQVAASVLANASTDAKNKALRAAATEIRRSEATVLAQNALDVAAMRRNGATVALIDRGTLNPSRIASMAQSLEDIAALPDPGRQGHRRMGPAERPSYRARAHAARRDRRDL